MTTNKGSENPVLIIGSCKAAETVAVCLLMANHPVVILTEQVSAVTRNIAVHAQDVQLHLGKTLPLGQLTITDSLPSVTSFLLAIIITSEQLQLKQEAISLAETILDQNTPIAINTESIALQQLQKEARYPGRIIGANWVVPAHTTYFLEVITTGQNDEKLVADFITMATSRWGKDPYVIKSGSGIRSKLMCALIREAFYLIENGYVSHEDIDRACRNDAGYYLPFAGNFRYMDLMGTYIYGLVMKDINPDLTVQRHIPSFFTDKIKMGRRGMNSGHGMYEYKDGEVEKWQEVSRTFSYQIGKIIEKYKTV